MQRQEEISILVLGNDVIRDVIFSYLVAHELAAANNLARTSKQLNQLFQDLLTLRPVIKLLQLLNDASRLNPSGTFKTLLEIKEKVEGNPDLIFQSHKIRMICDNQVRSVSPIQFAFNTADRFLIAFLERIAAENHRYDEFDELAKSFVNNVLEDISPQIDAYVQLGNLAKLDLTQEEYDEYYNNLTQEEKDLFKNMIDEYICTEIGAAQASLPRWVLDEFFACYDETSVENNVAAQAEYTALEVNENGEDVTLDIEKSLTSPTHQLGQHFALFRDGDKIRAQKAGIVPEVLIGQAEQLGSIFNNRLQALKNIM